MNQYPTREQSLAVLERATRLTESATGKGKRARRLLNLLKSPDDAETTDWFMHLPACLNSALDIRRTPRKHGGIETLAWTQGSAFAFDRGDSIYDIPKAYLVWREALKYLNLCIEVDKGTLPATPQVLATEKRPGTPRNPGLVRFFIMTPNPERTVLLQRDEHQLTQDDFVRFLITGPTGELKEKIDRTEKFTGGQRGDP